MIFARLIALWGIAAADFDYRGRPTYEGIISFYQQDAVIYLLKRSYVVKVNGEHPTCVYNKVKISYRIGFTLEQGYTTSHGNVKYDVDAKSNLETKMNFAPIITTFRLDNKNITRKYHFHFYDPVAQCAVLTFTDYSGTVRCELHTWKKFASYKYYGNCQEEYDYQCPGRESHSVYLGYCPHIR
uniref:Lipocalin n=1 Tax=Rhipicephalus appendiculatus TaxID=34631 RepID=A0A131YRL3_RHIAP